MKNVAKYVQRHLIYLPNNIRDRLQISLLILSKVKWTYQLLIPLKSLEKLRFPDGFRGDESSLIRKNRLILDAKFGDDPLYTGISLLCSTDQQLIFQSGWQVYHFH